MGAALAMAVAPGPDRLLLCGNETRTAALALEIGQTNPTADVESAACSTNASWEADIIILAVPYSAEHELATKIREVANQKIVISVSNPFNKTFDGLLTSRGISAAEELQQLLPNSKVVKAFNTVFAGSLATPVIDGRQIDSFISGNDAEALATVAGLVRSTGLNPLIAGDLSMSRSTESMALLLIRLSKAYEYDGLPGWNILHN